MLARAGVRFSAHPYDHDASAVAAGLGYGEEAARALGVPPDRVFKTLLASVDGTLTVAVVPVGSRLDLKALAAPVDGRRAEMAPAEAAERATGYVVGGISPLGQRRRLPTVVDASALRHATVPVSAGRRGLDVELTPSDLVRLADAVVASVARA
jgi:Cys-tRNA(Pro)/Cys-tRNA(Cys) deacylase